MPRRVFSKGGSRVHDDSIQVFTPPVPSAVEGPAPATDDVIDAEFVDAGDAPDPPALSAVEGPALSAVEGTADFRQLTPDEQRELKAVKDALDYPVRQDILIALCAPPGGT